ncbi:hypothetical protein [Chitinophaga eiseniae]|uniref:Uncharacterized protein n=1 Tax=Chitinophaga eiseniae TaxID=634771 RepID=A0A847SPX8_9BACT|nr:hypothetical protein [Chitinophaga eiseniae]NLR82013.1 hypothetical protein [Chitinophaga eiseniae]
MGMSFVVALSNKVYHPQQLSTLQDDFRLKSMEPTGESVFNGHLRMNATEWTMSVCYGEKGTVIICPASGVAESTRVRKASVGGKTALITYNDNAMFCYISVFEDEAAIADIVYADGMIQFGVVNGDVFSYARSLFGEITGTDFGDYIDGEKVYNYKFSI